MAARPRIGVTGTARRFAPAWWCTRLALALCGARAARISLRHEQDPEDIDGLVIGGGNDIAPEHYGGVLEGPVRMDTARDALEIHWVRGALERGNEILALLAIILPLELLSGLQQVSPLIARLVGRDLRVFPRQHRIVHCLLALVHVA